MLPTPLPSINRTWLNLLYILFIASALQAGLASEKDSGPARPLAKIEFERTALDDYVAAPDTNFEFHVVNAIPGKDHTVYVLEMTSQAWLTTNEVDRPLWKHWVIITKPNDVKTSRSLLFISGGGN